MDALYSAGAANAREQGGALVILNMTSKLRQTLTNSMIHFVRQRHSRFSLERRFPIELMSSSGMFGFGSTRVGLQRFMLEDRTIRQTEEERKTERERYNC